MEHDEQEEILEPVSPNSQYLRSTALSVTILGVLEFQVPIDDSMILIFLKDVFVPVNPRFSSIMVTGKKGIRKWKKVEVNLRDHITVPVVPSGMAVEYYDECFTEYLSKIAMEQLPQNRPLWEVHILKYPTKNAAGNLIFKLHHSLGDGYSLMGALLSGLQRADDPSVPLTFPSRKAHVSPNGRKVAFFRRAPRLLVHTASDLIKSSLVQDDKSPIRSGEEGVEFKPIVTTTTTFSIDQLKEIKNRLNVTINDVMTGIVSFGSRLYMQKTRPGSGAAKSTALMMFNTRATGGYKSAHEMTKPDSKMRWGNRFSFLHVSIPKLTEAELQNPLGFVNKAHRTVKRHKNSAAAHLTGHFLNFITKIRGHEATARRIHATLKNTSMAISNLIGPVEHMSLANQPVKGLYFLVAGAPQSLSITMISYVGTLRMAITVERGFMDPNKLKSCIEYAFQVIFKAAIESAPAPIN